MTLCRNSRTRRGSISVDEVARNRRFEWARLNMSVGGVVFGRYIKLGRGTGCARYRGSSWVAERGREV